MEELVIPLRLDADEALRKLHALGMAGKQAGDKIDEATDMSTRRLTGMAGAAENVMLHLGGMLTISAGMGAISGAFSTIAQGLSDAADHAARLTKEFTDFRRAQVGAAGVLGEAPSSAFTLDQVKLAEQAGISPTQFTKFQEAMNQAAIGNVAMTPDQVGQPGKQLTREQYARVTQKTAAFGVARDLSPEAIATLTGALIRQATPGADADTQVLQKFGELVELMDASPGKVERLLPELNEVMATGQSPQEAGKQVSVMAGRGRPQETGTFARAMGRGIRTLFAKGKAEGFGMTMEQTDIQAAEKLYSAAQQSGIDMENPRAVDIWLKEQGIMNDEERQGFLAMFNIGFKGGGVKSAEAAIKAGGVAAMDRSIGKFQDSDEGKQQAAENQLEANRLKIGARRSKFALAQTNTKAEMQEDLQKYGIGGFLADWAPDSAFGTREELQVNQGALGKLEAEAIGMGVSKDALPFGGTGPGMLPIGKQAAGEHADTILRAMEKHMAELNRKTPERGTPPLAPVGKQPDPETRP